MHLILIENLNNALELREKNERRGDRKTKRDKIVHRQTLNTNSSKSNNNNNNSNT